MNEYTIWLIVIILIVILAPLIPAIYSDWDLKRQLSGKKKARTYKGRHFYPGKDESESPDMQIMKDELRTRRLWHLNKWR